MKTCLLLVATLGACTIKSETPDPIGPDAGVTVQPDAPVVVSEPKPAFTAGSEISGQLAVTDAGIRPTFTIDGTEYVSVVSVGLTETATQVHCSVVIAPHFVQFGASSTSTRQFKTVILDFAQAEILDDKCKWDDAYILATLADRFGNYVVGFAKPRFADDGPGVDVYLNATKGLGSGTASVVRAGGGSAYSMDANGVVVETLVQPTAGQPLVRALYDF